jgi:hypothetical protein
MPIIETDSPIKIDNITNLTRPKICQIWEMQVEYLFISIDTKEIVLKNLQLPNDAITNKLCIYQKIVKRALEFSFRYLYSKFLYLLLSPILS